MSHPVRSLAIGLTLMLLAACDQSPPPATTDAPPPPAAASASDEQPTYTVLSQPAYPPLSLRDTNGQMTGLDIDLLKAIGQLEGFHITALPHGLSGLLDTLESGQADIVSGIHITADKQANFDFSLPYLESHYAVLAPTKNKSFNDLQGKTIAVEQGGTSENQLRSTNITDKVLPLKTLYLAVTELKQGNAQGVYDVEYILHNYQKQYPEYHILPDEKTGKIAFGFALVKENSLLKSKLDKGLNTLRANGVYQKILDKWAGYGQPQTAAEPVLAK